MTLEQEAQFLVAKYGTAAGPVGLPRSWPTGPTTIDLALLLVLLGLIIFIIVLASIYRDWQAAEEARREAYRSTYE